MDTKKFATVDEYIAAYPAGVQAILQEVRTAVRQAAPGAEEVISYSMPAFKQGGVLVWYAAYKEHIGFYPGASGISTFQDQLTKYKTSKGAVQFPIDKPMPIALIKKIVRFRIKENEEKAALKAMAKAKVKKAAKAK